MGVKSEFTVEHCASAHINTDHSEGGDGNQSHRSDFEGDSQQDGFQGVVVSGAVKSYA